MEKKNKIEKKKINQLNLAEELNRLDIEELKRKGRRTYEQSKEAVEECKKEEVCGGFIV